jgi:hypothetical protein
MPLIPVGSYEATLIWQRTGAPRQATIALGLTDDVPGNRLPSVVADAVYAAATNVASIAAASFMATTYSFLGVSVTRQTETGPLIGQKLVTVAGTSVVEVMPPNCAVLINKSTGAGGRRNRGRFFAPPYYPPESGVDANGVIAGAGITNLQGRWSDFNTRLISAGLLPVLFHSEAPYTPTPVGAFNVQPTIATQRRRLRK